ncbi:PREDICTED: voltage-dependent anion-selective channel-like [Drosophila arizonae]|uniref:Voltage-dependent anion-selective channel-like n=1 Tax=Drosophila arizonae TaxID=7263 RepID=A0ABM1NQA6_DROAR|nr:PREDICTED: voltage-dependent anion-selective channel-like [Drosophila arizonae]
MSVFKKRRLTAWNKKKNRQVPAESAQEPDPADAAQEPHEAEYEIIPPVPLKGEVPTFFHIGRWAKECLITGYRIGVWHIDCTTRVKEELSMYSFGSAKPDFETITGGVGFKEKLGLLTMSQAWLTHEFFSSIGLQKRTDSIGGEAILRALYNRAETAYKIDLLCGVERSPVRIKVIAPIVHVTKIMGYALWQPAENFMLAYRTAFDFEEKSFEKHAFGVGYNNRSTELALKFEDFQDLRGSIFQRLSDQWAIAVKASLSQWENVEYSIGCQCMVKDSALIKAKITSQGYLAFVYQQSFTDSVRIMYHFGLSLDDPIKSNHKFGISWSINC